MSVLLLLHCNSNIKKLLDQKHAEAARRDGNQISFLRNFQARQMAIICDYVTLSRPLLILISRGGLTDSDEELEKSLSV